MVRVRVFLIKAFYPLALIYWRIFRPERRASKVVIKNGEEVLLIKHSFASGNWTFPGGGIKKREEPFCAAIRECQEELMVKLEELEHRGVVLSEHEYRRDIIHVYSAKASRENLVLNPVEIAEAKWFRSHEVPKLTEFNQAILSKANDRFK